MARGRRGRARSGEARGAPQDRKAGGAVGREETKPQRSVGSRTSGVVPFELAGDCTHCSGRNAFRAWRRVPAGESVRDTGRSERWLPTSSADGPGSAAAGESTSGALARSGVYCAAAVGSPVAGAWALPCACARSAPGHTSASAVMVRSSRSRSVDERPAIMQLQARGSFRRVPNGEGPHGRESSSRAI